MVSEHKYNKVTSDKIELQTFPAWYVDIIPAYQIGFKIYSIRMPFQIYFHSLKHSHTGAKNYYQSIHVADF